MKQATENAAPDEFKVTVEVTMASPNLHTALAALPLRRRAGRLRTLAEVGLLMEQSASKANHSTQSHSAVELDPSSASAGDVSRRASKPDAVTPDLKELHKVEESFQINF